MPIAAAPAPRKINSGAGPTRDAFEIVIARFDKNLMRALGQTVPWTVHAEVMRQVEGGLRTPEQLAERVTRRWRRSYEDKPWREQDPADIALALVKATCDEPRCEDGWLLPTVAWHPRGWVLRAVADAEPERCLRCFPPRPTVSGQVVEVAMIDAGAPSTPERCHEFAAAMRAQLRAQNGRHPGQRGVMSSGRARQAPGGWPTGPR